MPDLMRQINMISRISTAYRERRLKSIELSFCHCAYIIAVCEAPGISQDKLAKQIGINKSNVTRQLSYLEKKGYVERKQCPNDKRIQLVYPTQKATEALPIVTDTVKNWQDNITEGFSADELDYLSELLERMLSKAKEYEKNTQDKEKTK